MRFVGSKDLKKKKKKVPIKIPTNTLLNGLRTFHIGFLGIEPILIQHIHTHSNIEGKEIQTSDIIIYNKRISVTKDSEGHPLS